MAEEKTAPDAGEEAEEGANDHASRAEMEAEESAADEGTKAPVRYHLTLKARDLYLLVFGAALVIFAAFTLGAIVGRYMGPYPDQKVTAKLEREDLFEETPKQEAATETPKEAKAKKPPGEASEAPEKQSPIHKRAPTSSPSPSEIRRDKWAAWLHSSPAESPEATPTAKPTPKSISKPKLSPKPKRTLEPSPSPMPKKTPKPVSTKKPLAAKKPVKGTEKAQSVSTYYSVQVGAYKSRANAESEVKKLKRSGFDAWLRPPGKRERLYLVVVGREKTAANCDSTAKKLIRQGHKDLWIRRFSESQ